jgi:hypothetical protein
MLCRLFPLHSLTCSRHLHSSSPRILQRTCICFWHIGSSDTGSEHNPHRFRSKRALTFLNNSIIAKAVIETFTEEADPAEASESHPDLASMTVHDKLALWDRNEHHTEAPDRVPWGNGIDEDEPVEFSLEFEEYRDVLLRSHAFSWLLNSALNESKLEIPGLWPDHLGRTHTQIRATILSHLNAEAEILRQGAPPPSHCILFRTHWPEKFLRQEYTLPPHEVLDKVLVLTGNAQNCWATTTKQYLEMVWPDFGPPILDIYRALLEGRDVVKSMPLDPLSDHSRVC